MATDLQQLVEHGGYSPEVISGKSREIYERVLRESKHIRAGNFDAIHPADLRRMFALYDETFFGGGCQLLLGSFPLHFRISRRMTRAGGKTARREFRDPRAGSVRKEYEISVSATLLFQTFHDVHRPVTVTGVVCRDRLEALQRIFEHELVHLIEMLIWVSSSCSAARFQSIASRFFGHRQHTHQLITTHERAFTKFGIKPGDRVSFRLDGRHLVGVVNRITRRATVLVESPQGTPYTDGKRYSKFYVPLTMLKPA
jgi:hypothetical protein